MEKHESKKLAEKAGHKGDYNIKIILKQMKRQYEKEIDVVQYSGLRWALTFSTKCSMVPN
jgi:hypothetical protein